MKLLWLKVLPLLILLPIAGCGTGNFLGSLTTAPNLTGNWQMQSGTGTSGNTAAGILLVGALESQGSLVTGTFRFSDLAPGNLCGTLNQVVTLSGSIDQTNHLTLTSAPFSGSTIKMSLLVPPLLTNFATGTIEVDGPTCNFGATTGLGVEIAPVSGTYNGSLSPTNIVGGGATTNANFSVALTQSSTPAADGQFPLSGTVQYSNGSCTATYVVTGTASGVGITLATVPSPLGLSALSIHGAVNTTATQIPSVSALFFPAPCGTLLSSSAYSGALTRQ